MPRGGRRPGAGAKPKPKLQIPDVDKGMARRVLERIKEEEKIVTLLEEAFANDRRLFWEVVKEMQHQAGRKPVHTVNHLHDKPLEVNHHHTLSERFRIAIEKAEKRVRDGR